jgi:hypothetical protein
MPTGTHMAECGAPIPPIPGASGSVKRRMERVATAAKVANVITTERTTTLLHLFTVQAGRMNTTALDESLVSRHYAPQQV